MIAGTQAISYILLIKFWLSTYSTYLKQKTIHRITLISQRQVDLTLNKITLLVVISIASAPIISLLLLFLLTY